MSLNPLPLDIWYEILVLVDIKEAIALSKAFPRFFGAFIESKRAIRFQNTLNSYMSYTLIDLPVGPLASFIRFVMRHSSFEFSGFVSWLTRRLRPVLTLSIVENRRFFEELSRTIALKDREFVSLFSYLSSCTVEIKGEFKTVCSVSWILLYRASISGYRAADFHRACDGIGKCVIVVKAENGRIAVAYNEDGFCSGYSRTPNLNGFIVSVDGDGRRWEIFHRNDQEMAVCNHPSVGPVLGRWGGDDLAIYNNCHQSEYSYSRIGRSYGRGFGDYERALFGKKRGVQDCD